MFRFDKARLDLAREFRVNPFGKHSPDLQYLLNLMRHPTPEPFYVLLADVLAERWTLAVMTVGGREPPQPTRFVFAEIEEAEWQVFKLRWAALAGEELCID